MVEEAVLDRHCTGGGRCGCCADPRDLQRGPLPVVQIEPVVVLLRRFATFCDDSRSLGRGGSGLVLGGRRGGILRRLVVVIPVHRGGYGCGLGRLMRCRCLHVLPCIGLWLGFGLWLRLWLRFWLLGANRLGHLGNFRGIRRSGFVIVLLALQRPGGGRLGQFLRRIVGVARGRAGRFEFGHEVRTGGAAVDGGLGQVGIARGLVARGRPRRGGGRALVGLGAPALIDCRAVALAVGVPVAPPHFADQSHRHAGHVAALLPLADDVLQTLEQREKVADEVHRLPVPAPLKRCA